MTHETGGAKGTVLASCVLGLFTWIQDPEVWRAMAVAALCGVIGGMFRPVGSKLSERMHRKWDERNKKPTK